jgi:hypothetical protein
MGQKYAAYSADRTIIAFYDSIDSPLPSPLPEGVAGTVDITDDQWTYLLDGQSSGKVMTIGENDAPTLVDQPAPSAEQIAISNAATRDALLGTAAIAIAPLQDAVDLDIATDADKARLSAWKQYRVAVNRTDLTKASPAWPAAPADA